MLCNDLLLQGRLIPSQWILFADELAYSVPNALSGRMWEKGKGNEEYTNREALVLAQAQLSLSFAQRGGQMAQ